MYFTLLAVLDCIYGAKLLQVFLKLFSLQIHTSTQAPIRLRLNGRKLTENKRGRLQSGAAVAVVGSGRRGQWVSIVGIGSCGLPVGNGHTCV